MLEVFTIKNFHKTWFFFVQVSFQKKLRYWRKFYFFTFGNSFFWPFSTSFQIMNDKIVVCYNFFSFKNYISFILVQSNKSNPILNGLPFCKKKKSKKIFEYRCPFHDTSRVAQFEFKGIIFKCVKTRKGLGTFSK